jgi:hypothetical protein
MIKIKVKSIVSFGIEFKFCIFITKIDIWLKT